MRPAKIFDLSGRFIADVEIEAVHFWPPMVRWEGRMFHWSHCEDFENTRGHYYELQSHQIRDARTVKLANG